MSPRRVLVVEDDALNARLFRKVLEKRLGCEVVVTEEPAEVLAILRRGEVQLVIMDVSLHNSEFDGRPINGVGICRLLKSENSTARVPVLLATAHAMRGDAERLLADSGADDYVSKPIVDHEAFAAQALGLMEEAA